MRIGPVYRQISVEYILDHRPNLVSELETLLFIGDFNEIESKLDIAKYIDAAFAALSEELNCLFGTRPSSLLYDQIFFVPEPSLKIEAMEELQFFKDRLTTSNPTELNQISLNMISKVHKLWAAIHADRFFETIYSLEAYLLMPTAFIGYSRIQTYLKFIVPILDFFGVSTPSSIPKSPKQQRRILGSISENGFRNYYLYKQWLVGDYIRKQGTASRHILANYLASAPDLLREDTPEDIVDALANDFKLASKIAAQIIANSPTYNSIL